MQVVTTLKNTAKPVTEVPFPAVTICGSGLHMSTVEEKILHNFEVWRNETGRQSDNIRQDMAAYMETKFQIKPSEDGTQPANILEILDTMIASDVEASFAVNAVRKNVAACQQANDATFQWEEGECLPDNLILNIEGLKDSNDTHRDPASPDSNLSVKEQHLEWVGNYEVREASRERIVYGKTDGKERYIYVSINEENLTFESWCPKGDQWGCRDGEGKDPQKVRLFDGSLSRVAFGRCGDQMFEVTHTYNRFFGRAGSPRGNSYGDGTKWGELDEKGYEGTDKYPTPQLTLQGKVQVPRLTPPCIEKTSPEISNQALQARHLPGIDIFLNPEMKKQKQLIAQTKETIARNYFHESNMTSLYPELFNILWDSTLPCFSDDKEHLLLSCQLAGVNVNCSRLFKRVPTDVGICCAINTVDNLKESEYGRLIKDLQGESETEAVRSMEGLNMGLRLTLDLHSNTVSFGTVDQEYDAFKVFIGQPSEFPQMSKKGVQLEPGREHFVELSATTVSTNDINGMPPEARNCFFSAEGDLEFYEKYTHSNCRLECAIKEAASKFGCVPWHLPKVGSFFRFTIASGRQLVHM